MGLIRAVAVILAGCHLSVTAATAQDLCPDGPFQTDVRAIAAAMSSHPLRPAWDASAEFIKGPDRLTDGIYSYGAGGLMNPGGRSLSYDWKRYVVVSVDGDWASPHRHANTEYTEELPNRVVREIGKAIYITTIARPTPEQARKYACLANRLMVALQHSPARTQSDNGNSQDTSGDYPFTDGHDERFEFLSGGSPVYNSDFSDPISQALFQQMNQLTEDWLAESSARARGQWHAPHVADVAVDDTDNLYLLLNPGSLQHPSIDILKRAPSGGMTRLPVSIGWWSPYPDTFALDGQGHVWVPVPDASEPKAWLYEVESDGVPNYVDGSKPPPAPALTQIHQLIDSIAIATNNAHLYAMRGSDIFEITTPGTRIPRNAGIAPDDVVTSIANISQWAKTRWFSHRPASHIAAASDGALFISDPESDTIFKVSPEKIVTVFAGIPGKSGATDGPGDSARFNSPKGLALDRQGNLYVADSGNRTIRRITPDGLVSTVVGNPGKRGTVDGQGKVVRLDRPASIAIDSTGTLYVTNGVDNLIRKISPAGVVSTLNAEGWFDPP
jgi:hypothetical protein